MKRETNAETEKGWKMTSEKDKIIKDLKAEDKRLCMIISNLHTEIAGYNEKIKKQEHIISTQQDIINNLIELIKAIQI